MKKIILISLLLIISICCKAQTLSQMSDALNNLLPEVYQDIITIEKTSYSNNTFTWYFTIEGGNIYNFTNFPNHPTYAKEFGKIWTMSMYKKDSYMFNRMIDKRVTENLNVYDKSHNVHVTISLKPSDLRSMISQYYKMSEDLLSLKMQEVSTKCQAPIAGDNTSLIIDANLTSAYFEYVYEVNDGAIDFNIIKTKDYKDAMINNIKNMPQYQLDTMIAIANTNRSLKLTYIGHYSDDIYSVIITNQEVKQALK